MREGLVTKLTGGNYTIKDLETKEIHSCKASGKLRYVKVSKGSDFLKEETNKDKRIVTVSPKVGDIVLFENNYIEQVTKRKNSLRRPDVANVDQVVLIFAAKDPLFSFNLLDNFIFQIEREQIPIKIIITKIDLLLPTEFEALKKELAYYQLIGYDIYFTSKITKDNLEDIEEVFSEKISVLAGQTGAGKSSLLNLLDDTLNLDTQEISKALGRGKHTTRHTELLPYHGGYIADTPGFSSLDFVGCTLDDLKQGFKDFAKLSSSCRFKGCNHINEPDCNVKNNLDTILKTRYENYLKFYQEIKNSRRI